MRVLGLLALCWTCLAWGEARPQDLEFVQHLGAPLPLQLILRDESGRAVVLGDYFDSRPVVLVLGYFQCRKLCSSVLDGVLEGLDRTDLPGASYRLLAVSIDPRDGSPAARGKRAAHREQLKGKDVRFLTGPGEATGELARRLGFPYAWDPEQGQYAHPAGLVLATPEGRISRYFLGLGFNPRELRSALAEAAAGRTGKLGDRLLLLCSPYDPETGRYSFAAMAAVRAICLGVALVLALWIRKRAGRAP